MKRKESDSIKNRIKIRRKSAPKVMICSHCGCQLPAIQFEMMKTGTRRHVCNKCKYLLYTLPAYQRRKMEACGL